MPPSGKKIEAMFDVRPTNESGVFDLARFENMDKTLDLKSVATLISKPELLSSQKITRKVTQEIAKKPEILLEKKSDLTPPAELERVIGTPKIIQPSIETYSDRLPAFNLVESKYDSSEAEDVGEQNSLDLRQNTLKELENIISSPIDIHAELARVGGVFVEPNKPQVALARPTLIPVVDYQDLLRHVGAKPQRNVDLDFWSRKSFSNSNFANDFRSVIPAVKRSRTFNISGVKSRILNLSPKFLFGRNRNKWLALVGVVIFGSALLLSSEKNNIENNVVANGKNAVENITVAKQQLEESKFFEAGNSFALAHDDFFRANHTLARVGSSFSWLLQYIPGLNKISSANNITLAGQHMTQVGQDVSLFLESASKIQLANLLSSQTGTGQSFHELFRQLKEVANKSKSRVDKTKKLLAHINPNILPEDKKELWALFADQLPQLSEFLNQSLDYTDALVALVPEKGPRKYLILFQNNSELRATGGFPGSYAVVSFDDGSLIGIKVDDIYNPDGQLKTKTVPPEPLQHITPTWGARDANWFADFPTSARKIIEYYREGSGESVNGVITLTPDIIIDILKLTGPIPMPDYGVTLGADNFLAQVQEEVEYGERRPGQQTPKKILIDFFPLFLEKLGSAKASWLDVAGIFSRALEEKHMLAYFDDNVLQSLVAEKGFSGALDADSQDYLEVVYTNVKGSKTDVMTDSSLKLLSKLNKDESVDHQLQITRTHRGGDMPLRFYNLQNPAYVRVYVPKEAELEFIDGNDIPDFQPLVYYSSDYRRDPDLERIKSSSTHPYTGVDVFQESGKTVFGFWMILDPKDTKTVTLRYKVKDGHDDDGYDLLIQKQAGTRADPLEVEIEQPNGEHSNLKTDLRVDRRIELVI